MVGQLQSDGSQSASRSGVADVTRALVAARPWRRTPVYRGHLTTAVRVEGLHVVKSCSRLRTGDELRSTASASTSESPTETRPTTTSHFHGNQQKLL